MKKTIYMIGLYFIINSLLKAQEIKVHTFVGKSLNDVITSYGKPIYQDKTNPDMICTFYQTNTKKYVFISDANGVYQAQADLNFKTKEEAQSVLDDLIINCIQDGYKSDTLGTDKFKIHRKGNLLEVNVSQLTDDNKCLISVKATKSEE
ncbi:MAG: hypothetical protein A2V66_17990 [Ignavibacteria bacterium RBG_13_36_8]|nr:MAG: hypothetical protein A2V66_17990 [Ignavibacteria bacterium RBG_13_36_8]